VLRAGSLPVDLEVLQESTVGPELGRDSIRRGLRSVVVAGLLVLLFIGLYYLACGLVADAALVLNLVFLTGVLGLLGAALTLPGVAGILLTIGMAVDANVLIFERIREESAAGKPPHVALRNGYDRAYITIVDANVTTLLTAVILYLVGTGPVRGFAVTLSAGIALSMFTALFVTRLVFETLLAAGRLSGFRMMGVIARPSLSYSSLRHVAFGLSGLVVTVGLVAFFWRGSELYDVDFTGGSLARLSLGRAVSPAEVRKRLKAGGFPRAQVQGLRTPAGSSEGTTDFRIRIKGLGERSLRERVVPEVAGRLRAAGLLDGGRVSVGADGRSLELTLGKPVGELQLRRALAGEGGDPFEFLDVSMVTPMQEVPARRFMLRLMAAPPLVEMPELWDTMLGVLALAWVRFEPCAVSTGAVEPAGEGGGRGRLTLSTDRPIQWELLAAELVKREFYRVRVESTDGPAKQFVLTGPLEALERVKGDMPATLRLPIATIEGLSVRGELQEPFKEKDLRAFAEKMGLKELRVVALDAPARRYRLEFSYKGVRRRLAELFSDLGSRHIAVEVRPVEAEPDAAGNVPLKLRFSEPLPIPEIRYYLEQAGLRRLAEKMSVDERLETLVRSTNEGRWDNVWTRTVTVKVPAEKRQEAERLIASAFSEADPVGKIDSIGSVVAKEMQGRALLAVICASVIIVFYVAIRFHAFRFGVAAVVALIHDILITAGLLALADWSGAFGDLKINLPMLAAFLTILGYSLNDTIVVFDRIRENMVGARRKALTAEVIDSSVNQVLNRTILTSLTTLLVVVVLYFMGGAVLQGLAFTLIVGVIVGTYSSVFIASPILLDWPQISRGARAVFAVVSFPLRAPFLLARLGRKAPAAQAGDSR